MKQIEKEILRKFMYNYSLKYNQIWDRKLCSSSNFDYHLKKLMSDGFIVKDDDVYKLSNIGISFISSLDGVEIENKKKPLSCSFALAFKDGKVLLSRRKKQPFINHLNIPGGKIEFGNFSKEEAIREFEEETGLIPSRVTLKVIAEKITYDKETNDISHHIIGFFYLVDEFVGELKKNTREGDCFWYLLSELENETKFKELDILIPQIVFGKGIRYYTFERVMDNDIITDYKLIDEIRN